jgi:hypothetical protein
MKRRRLAFCLERSSVSSAFARPIQIARDKSRALVDLHPSYGKGPADLRVHSPFTNALRRLTNWRPAAPDSNPYLRLRWRLQNLNHGLIAGQKRAKHIDNRQQHAAAPVGSRMIVDRSPSHSRRCLRFPAASPNTRPLAKLHAMWVVPPSWRSLSGLPDIAVTAIATAVPRCLTGIPLASRADLVAHPVGLFRLPQRV